MEVSGVLENVLEPVPHEILPHRRQRDNTEDAAAPRRPSKRRRIHVSPQESSAPTVRERPARITSSFEAAFAPFRIQAPLHRHSFIRLMSSQSHLNTGVCGMFSRVQLALTQPLNDELVRFILSLLCHLSVPFAFLAWKTLRPLFTRPFTPLLHGRNSRRIHAPSNAKSFLLWKSWAAVAMRKSFLCVKLMNVDSS